jgi:hypothetical protein
MRTDIKDDRQRLGRFTVILNGKVDFEYGVDERKQGNDKQPPLGPRECLSGGQLFVCHEHSYQASS